MLNIFPVAPDTPFQCSKKGLSVFLYLFVFWVILGAVLWVMYGNIQLFQWVHTRHTPLADIFFKYFTYFGTALVIIPTLLLIFWFRQRNRYLLMLIIATQVGSLLVNQAMKFGFAHPRPVAIYGEASWFHHIAGEVLHRSNSFPSGHTAGAFAFVFLLALLCRRYQVVNAVLFFGAAVLAAYSRMYLGQHFFVDIYIGSIEGVLVCLSILWLFRKAGYCSFVA